MKAMYRIVIICALFIVIGVVAVILLSYFSIPKQASVNKESVENESLRLQGVAMEREFTNEDLANLNNLTKNDPKSHSEFLEIEWFMDHNFSASKHIGHSLNSLYWIAKQGKWLCPADSFSHVGLFLLSNDSDLANDAFNDGQETLSEWTTIARSLHAKNASYYSNAEDLISVMNDLVANYNENNFEKVKEDSKKLEEIGYC